MDTYKDIKELKQEIEYNNQQASKLRKSFGINIIFLVFLFVSALIFVIHYFVFSKGEKVELIVMIILSSLFIVLLISTIFIFLSLRKISKILIVQNEKLESLKTKKPWISVPKTPR